MSLSPKQLRHRQGARVNALAVFEAMNANPKQDFHTLKLAQVDILLEEADRVRYQKPANANGSRARYFYQRLQREATY